MTIKRKPVTPAVDATAVEKFVQGAPDAKDKDEATSKEKLMQISMTISASDLKLVDEAAKRMRVSRAGFIRNAIFKAIPGEDW